MLLPMRAKASLLAGRGQVPLVAREWICGDPDFSGPAFGSVSGCMGFRRSGPTVVLFGSREKAEAAKRVIDATACGSNCSRSHRVIELTRDGRVQA